MYFDSNLTDKEILRLYRCCECLYKCDFCLLRLKKHFQNQVRRTLQNRIQAVIENDVKQSLNKEAYSLRLLLPINVRFVTGFT